MKPATASPAALLLHNANYRNTWLAQVVSEIGDYFNNVAVFALVMEKSGSGMVVSGVMLARAIPAVLAGPIAGVLLDRMDRKRIMIASDLVRAVVALAFVLTVHQPRPWLLYVLSAVLMFASPFFTAGRAAILPTIATKEELHAANSLTQTTQWATLTVGTLLAGYSAAQLGYSCGVRDQRALVRVLGVRDLAHLDARRIPRGAARGRAAHARLARVPRRAGVHAVRAADDGDRDDLRGLGDGRRRGADSVRAVRRAGVSPRRVGDRRHLGLRGHRPAGRRRDRALRREAHVVSRATSARSRYRIYCTVWRTCCSARWNRGPRRWCWMMMSRVGMAVTSVLNNTQLLRHTPDEFRGRVFSHDGIDALGVHDYFDGGGGDRFAVRFTQDHRISGGGVRGCDRLRLGVDGWYRSPEGTSG